MRNFLKMTIIPLLVFSSFSCNRSNQNELNEEDKVMIERSLLNELKDISYDEFKEKCQNKDTFVSFIYSEECYHCYQVKKNFLPDFFNEYDLRIYGVCMDRIKNSDLAFIGEISKDDVPYYKYNETDDWHTIYFPTVYIVEEGFISYYTTGTKAINESFFKNHLVIDKKASKYSSKDKILLTKEENPSLNVISQVPSSGIVYYTSSVENEEIKYYLKPYIEDKSISINVIVDENLTSNKLSIVSNDKEIKSSTQKKDYLALLNSYIEVI